MPNKQPADTLQEAFLKRLQEQRIPVTLFLVNGIKLQGHLTYYDKFGVALTRDKQTQFVFKHGIAAINPVTTVELSSGDDIGL